MSGGARTVSVGADPVRVPVGRWVEPAAVWAVLASDRTHLVWSDRRSAPADRVDFIGMPRSDADLLTAGSGASLADVCERLRQGLPAVRSARLGWWGWFGYELGATSQDVDGPASDQEDAAFLLATRGVEIDHDRRRVDVVALPGDEAWAERVALRISELEAPRDPPPPSGAVAAWRLDRAAYLRAIEACLAAIRSGDAYQLCLTNRVTVTSPTPIDDGDLLRRLRAGDRSEHAGVLRFGDRSLVSTSPESFLHVDPTGLATTRPIKGTRPRGRDPAEDDRFAAELLASEKERAENLMIVDLMRNDLSRVAEVGSVEVARLFDVERLAAVHHLVSTVAARLVGDALTAVPALLPAGSMTGAPKRSAMQHLARLEGGPRGVYSGAWGRISGDGSVDLAVVIRSAVLHGAVATIGTGGGITALSDPAAEWEEVLLKAAPLLRALGAS